MGFAEGDHQPREAEHVGVRFEPIPVEPGGRVALSWLYGLLFPFWVWRNSSPARSIGVPLARKSRHRRFLAWRLRNAITSAGAPSSPLNPEFQLMSAGPSVLPWPFAMLRFVS